MKGVMYMDDAVLVGMGGGPRGRGSVTTPC